jgi:glycosyltransferase involved in cell wall biosynthesis
LRILHVYSGNLYGGIESILAAIARRGRANEHEFALCFDGRLSAELAAAGATVHLLGAVSMRKPHSAAAARRALASVLHRRTFDRVICHAPWTQGLFGGVIRRAGRPLVFWAHDVMTGRHWTERLARRVPPDLAVCNSHFTARSLAALYPGLSPVIIYAPVEIDAPVETAAAGGIDRGGVRAALGTPSDNVVIVQACRSEEWKGHESLLEALVALRDMTGWTWWQIGGAQRPHEQAFLRKLRDKAERAGIGDRVRWLGERSDVRQLLRAADLYCQPNRDPEPFGIAFVEALAAGLPVVTTRQGAADEVLDATCAVLVPPGHAVALEAALRELIVDTGLRRRLAARAPERAQQLCDPAAQIERLRIALTGMSPLSVPA